MDEFTQFISNVGFPIAAFCAMYYMCNTTLKENTNAIQKCAALISSIIDKEKEEPKSA